VPEPELPLVVAIVGSPRLRGNTAILVDVALSTDGDVPIFSAGGHADTVGSAAEKPELLAAARRLAADLAGVLLAGA